MPNQPTPLTTPATPSTTLSRAKVNSSTHILTARQTQWTARVFDRLSGQLGTKMAELYKGVAPDLVMTEWAIALVGFSADEIATGLDACQTRRFAPTLGEFLQLCRPSLDAEVAWHEASSKLFARERGEAVEWSHPAVYRAALEMRDALRQGGLRACRNRWEAVLRAEFSAGFGAGVPDRLVALAAPLERACPMPDAVRQRLRSSGLLLAKLAL